MLRSTSIALVTSIACLACSASKDHSLAEPIVAGFRPALAASSRAEPLAARAEPGHRAALALGYRPASGHGASIERAQRLVRSDPDSAAGYIELARALVAEKRRSGDAALVAYALDALEAAEALAPSDPAALALRGVVLAEDHRFADLADLAAEMIAAAPDDATGYLLAGDAHLELGDYDAAARDYEAAMDRYPDLRVYARAAYLRWLHGDVEGALEMFDSALGSGSRDPEHLAWCLTDLGKLFLHRGDPDRALAAAGRAEALVSGYPQALSLRARAERARGNLDAAADAARRAVAARPTAADQLLLSEIEEARGRPAAAAAARRAGLALASRDPLPAARYLARRGEQHRRALELAERASKNRPNFLADDARALALLRAGRPGEARRAIDRALRLGTPLAELHLHRGLILAAAGDAGGARAELDRARALDRYADPRLTAELEEKI